MDFFFFTKIIANTRMISNGVLKNIARNAVSIAIGALEADPNDFGISKYDGGYVCGVVSEVGTLIIKLGEESSVSGVTAPLKTTEQTNLNAIKLKVAGDACYSYIQCRIDHYLSD